MYFICDRFNKILHRKLRILFLGNSRLPDELQYSTIVHKKAGSEINSYRRRNNEKEEKF